MNILIVENEEKQRVVLESLIGFTKYKNANVKSAEGVSSANEILKDFQPDVVLLDVELNDGNGFDFLEHNQRNFEVIFVTGKEEYALKALKNKAADYLLKPIDPLELEEALEKCNTGTLPVERKKEVNYITLNTSNNLYKVPCNEILYCESEGNYTTVFSNDDKKIVASKTLKDIEGMLPIENFIRVHRSFLVNRNYIFEFNKIKNEIILKGGVSIPVSKGKKQELLEEF